MVIDSKKLTIIYLIVIILIGTFLRFYKNTENPPSLNGDEISFGYSAYSIINTGKDEHGKYLPLVFKSVGDYKNPVPVYLMTLPIKLFGLNDFSVRFNNAFFGVLFIPFAFYFFNYLFRDKRIALAGSLIVTISSWFIFYSRFAYEPLIGAFFVLLGVWSMMKFLDGRNIFLFISGFFLILTMYTAFAPRMFVPIFLAIFMVSKYRLFLKKWKLAITFGIFCTLLVMPLVYVTLYSGAGTRLNMVFLGHDIQFSRYVLMRTFDGIKDAPLLFFFWTKRLLSYLRPDFLFFNGMHMTELDQLGLGILYIYELPWLILGIVSFINQKIKHKDLLLLWLITGIVPDSLTNNQQHGGRLLHIAIVIIILASLGLIKFIDWIFLNKSRLQKLFIGLSCLGIILLVLIHAYLTFVVHYPKAKGESIDEGLREVVLYIKDNQHKYGWVVIDPRHGADTPEMISNPYLYLLFYLKYDPEVFQADAKIFGTQDKPYFQFGKYITRYINWYEDSSKKDTLFIGSPWSFPVDKMKEGEILETFYLTNGKIAYYAVSPK